MSQTRGILVPVEHLTAEMAAVPLASPAALGLSVVALDAHLGQATGRLWREAEAELVRAFPSFSIDELVSLRDWLWFHDSPKERPVQLAEYLRRVALATLEFGGNVFRPRLPPWATEKSASGTGSSEDAHARRFWRWVSFSLPPDLLMAAHPTPNAVTARIELVSPLLTRILQDKGFTEPHMHVGGAVEFSLLWIATLYALARPDMVGADSFRSPGAALNEGAELAHWLVRAAIARYLLGVFLEQQPRDDECRTFDAFLNRRVFPAFRSDGVHADPGAEPLLRAALRELAGGRLDPGTRFTALQHLYSRLTALTRRWPVFPEAIDRAYLADPLQLVFPARGHGQRTTEMEWTAAGLAFIEREQRAKREDRAFVHLFWQVIRVRNLYYRHVVQRPLTPGLQWFVRHYGRMWPGHAPLSPQLCTESAAHLCGRDLGLRAMEFRSTPRTSQSELELLVKQALGAIDRLEASEPPRLDVGAWGRDADGGDVGRDPVGRRGLEYGLVLHFSRDRGGGVFQGLPKARGYDSHADPSWPKNVGYRFSRFYRETRQQAHTLARLIQRFPRVLGVVRGLDLCTDEVGVPMWVMAPLCRYVREVSQAASAALQSDWREELPPLRMTVHAGEEFVHLLGGLRRVDEAIEYLNLGQGDRIGHGIALGTNPTEWAMRSSGIAVSRMERLLDLAWEWSFSTTRGIDLPASRTQYVLDQVERLSQLIFGEYADPTQVARFAELLRSEEELRLLNFPNGPLPDVEAYVRQRREQLTGEATADADMGSIDRRLADVRFRDDEAARRVGAELAQLYRRLPSMFKIRQGDEPWRLLARYLIEPETFHRGQTLMLVDPSFEAEILQRLQAELRRKVGSLGITVEINPSSNLLVGNLADLENHPLWRLKPPLPGSDQQAVAVCIGSDDPLTFSSRTREEYQLIYDTLTLAGLSDVEARAWLEDARETGLVSRFTLARRPERRRIWTGVNLDVSHIRPLL